MTPDSRSALTFPSALAPAVGIARGADPGRLIPPERLAPARTSPIDESFRRVPPFDHHDPSNAIRQEDRYRVCDKRNAPFPSHSIPAMP